MQITLSHCRPAPNTRNAFYLLAAVSALFLQKRAPIDLEGLAMVTGSNKWIPTLSWYQAHESEYRSVGGAGEAAAVDCRDCCKWSAFVAASHYGAFHLSDVTLELTKSQRTTLYNDQSRLLCWMSSSFLRPIILNYE
jgi:hypothetical protein